MTVHVNLTGGSVKVLTDNSHYEKIDKKERKKVYSKLNKPNFDNEESKEVETEIQESLKYSKDLVETDSKSCRAKNEQAKFEQKFRSKEIAQKKIKTHYIEGNLNRYLNPIDDLGKS